MLNNTFEFSRFLNILKCDLLENKKLFITSAFSLYGVLVILGLYFILQEKDDYLINTIYPTIIFLSGLALTSFSFHELYSEEISTNYIMIPASSFEKFCSKFLITTVIFIAVSISILLLGSFTLEQINSIFLEYDLVELNSINENLISNMKYYLIFHSMFFFSAIYFKRLVFVKTILSLHTILFLFAIFFYLTFRFLFAEGFAGFTFSLDKAIMPSSQSVREIVPILEVSIIVAQIIIKFFIPPFFWILSYMRLKEIEVKGEF